MSLYYSVVRSSSSSSSSSSSIYCNGTSAQFRPFSAINDGKLTTVVLFVICNLAILQVYVNIVNLTLWHN